MASTSITPSAMFAKGNLCLCFSYISYKSNNYI